MADPVVYRSWEQAAPRPIPPRSYLYHVTPMGLGSARVESLTSYLTRLAAAHDISVGVLLTREILPKVREEFRRHDYQAAHKIESTFVYDARTLNGVGQRSQDWISVLEQLTGVRGLQYLTMGTWRRVISGAGLLRPNRAWCPLCLDDSRSSNQPVSEQLIWALNEVSACPTHGCLLVDRCHHCRRDQHVISAKVKPGHCCRCRRWLGMTAATTDAPGDIDTRVALSQSIGELVSIAPPFAQRPDCEALLHNLKLCIDELADGSMSRFVAATGVSFDTMADWSRLPERNVRLIHLCRICTLVGIPPRLFVCRRLTMSELDCERGRKAVTEKTSQIKPRRSMYHLRPALEQAARAADRRYLRDVAGELGYTSLQALRRRAPALCDSICPKQSRRKVTPPAHALPSNETIEKALTAALTQPIPPPLKAIAIGLGLRNAVSLYSRFPDLCKAFTEKNALIRKADIERRREEIAEAADRTTPLSLKEVAAQLGFTEETLTYRYPDLCGKIVARISERKTREVERQRHELRTALMEDPLPSAEVISARTGRTLKHLGRIHPDLYMQYRERSEEAQRLAVLNRRAAFETEVRSATIELIGRGIHPSRRRVFSSIENPTLKSTRLLDRQIAATLFEFNLASGAPAPGGLGTQPGSLGLEPSAGRAVVEP
jgi:AraC-like DNA-binding protein